SRFESGARVGRERVYVSSWREYSPIRKFRLPQRALRARCGVMFGRLRRPTSLLGVVTIGVVLPACSGGEIVDSDPSDPSGSETGGAAATGGSGVGGTAGAPPQGVMGGTAGVPNGQGGAGANGGSVGTGGSSPPPNGGTAGTAPTPTGYLPARIRRLSNAEYDASIRA